jgi:hypothetical protein
MFFHRITDYPKRFLLISINIIAKSLKQIKTVLRPDSSDEGCQYDVLMK